MAEVFIEYHDGKPIENEDKELLDRLVMASYIDCVLKDGRAYAQASRIAKGLGELLYDALCFEKRLTVRG